MKKLFILAVAATFTLGLTSCKKDYTCTCTTTGGGVTASVSTTINDTKKNAKEACENGTSSVGGLSTTCTID